MIVYLNFTVTNAVGQQNNFNQSCLLCGMANELSYTTKCWTGFKDWQKYSFWPIRSVWLQKCLISVYHWNSKQVVQRLHEMRTQIMDWKWVYKATQHFLRRHVRGLGAGSPQVLRILPSASTQETKVFHTSRWVRDHLSTQLSAYQYVR